MEDKALELSKNYKTLLTKYEINTPLRLAHFFAQLAHESGLKPISENLNYSMIGLTQTFGKYFPTKAIASLYARQPEKIANKVYANRMGNGDETSGDGWKYRGKGFLQITGKDNYKALSKDTEVDYIKDPNLLLKEADAMISALWYWKRNGLNKFADKDDVLSITKAINGGTNGLDDRKKHLIEFKKIFKENKDAKK